MTSRIGGSSSAPLPQVEPKTEKSSWCCCCKKKEKRHSRQLTEHELAYTIMIRAERAAKKAFEERNG